MRKPLTQTGFSWIGVAFFVIVLDRISKMWVVNHLVLGDSLRVLPVFNLTLAHNRGAAFSMLHSSAGWQTAFFCTLALVVSLAIIYKLVAIPRQDRVVAIALNLILGGAIGNAWDRLQYGYVIDFLHFHVNDWHFAIFNVADAAICVGAALLIFFWSFKS